MTTANKTSYDEVPYESKPLFSTHPDCLAAAARLRGLSAPLASECRLLELGCAAGGNLIPMAYALPGSRFVGIDLSERQIAEGQRTIDSLGMKNIELRAGSITDIDESWGQFDYIVCHGVYSWVPPAVQERILWISKHLLAPHGAAYVSYNTYPGWHLKTVVRDLMKYHAARFDDPRTKVQQARSILQFMAGASAHLDIPMARMLKAEAEALPESADYYLYHEHLEDLNQPLYFHEFVSRARAVGLEYLGEAWHHTQMDNLPADVQETLNAISSDLIELEQFVDFLGSRTFRRTLVCHQDVPLVRTPDPAVMEPMYLAGLARPESKEPSLAPDKSEKFVLDDGSSATTNIPLLKAALLELFERWPTAIPFAELLTGVERRLAAAGQAAENVRPLLAFQLLRGYLANLVAVHCEPFRFQQAISQRPRASALARFLSNECESVPTLRHRLAKLPLAERALLRLVDGRRTVGQIAEGAQDAVVPLLTPEQQSAATPQKLLEFTERSLRHFARSALLEA